MKLMLSEKKVVGSKIHYSNKYMTEDGIMFMEITHDTDFGEFKCHVVTPEFQKYAFTHHQKVLLVSESEDFLSRNFVGEKSNSQVISLVDSIINVIVRNLGFFIQENQIIKAKIQNESSIKLQLIKDIEDLIQNELTRK